MPPSDTIYRTRRPLLAVLSLAACALAAWLAYLSLAGIEVPGCGGSSGCALAMFTRWAQWFNVPIGILAAGVYLLVACLSLVPAGRAGGRRHRRMMIANDALALAIGMAIFWFVGLQLLSVGAICTYCMVDHALGILVVLLLLHRRRAEALASDAPDRHHWTQPLFIGVGAFLSLLVGQFLGSPRATHDISRYAFGKGQIRITSADAPILGDRQASQVVLEMFDYTCPTCRQLAPQLKGAMERYQDQFAVLLVPCPIERKCNPFLRPGAVEHAEACAYAREAMAVWTAVPHEFRQFHDWLMLTDPIPTLEQTRDRAIQLVGREAYVQALQDKRIDRLITRGVDLYRGMGHGPMPKVLLGDRVMQGVPRSAEALYELLEKALSLHAEASGPEL